MTISPDEAPSDRTADEPGDAETPLPADQALDDSPTVPFYRQCPLTVAFSVLLGLVYVFTSYFRQFEGPAEWAVLLGGFYPPLVAQGEWWRFLTATLLHGHPGHLFSNVFGILVFGSLLEPALGSLHLLALYIVSAVLGLMFSYWFLPEGLSIGASTIGYGLLATYLGLILLLRHRTDRALFWQELRSAVAFVVIFVFLNTQSPGVNVWGHIGGFLAGVLFALSVFSFKRSA